MRHSYRQRLAPQPRPSRRSASRTPRLWAEAQRKPARSSARSAASELVAHPEAQRLALSRARDGATDLVITFERDIPRRLVDQSERRDPARVLFVAHGSCGNRGVRVVLLVAREGVQPLRALRRERIEEIVGALDIRAGD